jgi:dolichol kinase
MPGATVSAATTVTPTVEQFVSYLHAVLVSMDPATWRPDRASGTRDALECVRNQAYDLICTFVGPETGVQRAVRALYESLPDTQTLRERAEFVAAYETLSPLYEAIATALRQEGSSVRHLHPSNHLRSLVHMLAGLGIAATYELLLPDWLGPWVALAWVIWAWGLEGVRRWSPTVNDWCMWFFGPVAREHERYRINSATWYGTATFILAVTARGPAGVLALLALACGDPAAGIIGRNFGKTKLYRGRSLEGTMAFVFTAFAVGIGYLRWLHPEIAWTTALILAITASVVGAVVELTSKLFDDNLAIPVAAGWATTMVWWLLG